MTIHELNERRALAEMRMNALGMMNTPIDAEDQLKARAQYRLAYEAWSRAELEFRAALEALPSDDLMKLAT